MTSTCKPTRNIALDLIRVVAIVLVLWQHASEYYYIGDNLSVIHANIPLLTWINSVARICNDFGLSAAARLHLYRHLLPPPLHPHPLPVGVLVRGLCRLLHAA